MGLVRIRGVMVWCLPRRQALCLIWDCSFPSNLVRDTLVVHSERWHKSGIEPVSVSRLEMFTNRCIMFGFFRRRPENPIEADSWPEEAAEISLIEACRTQFESPPRSLDDRDSIACRISLTPRVFEVFKALKDPMLRILKDQDILRDRGGVVWGQLVQANQILFDPKNTETAPANVIYSLDPYFDGRIGLLEKFAGGLFAQKGSVPADRQLKDFIRVITDEHERILRRELPRGYCGGRSVHFTTCFIQPSHLPGNCLRRSSFPLLVNFRETEAVMVLSSGFWPEALVKVWQR